MASFQWAYDNKFEPYERRKADFLTIASPGGIYMSFANAEAISQIAERRNDFPKPVLVYKILELFGANVCLASPSYSTYR